MPRRIPREIGYILFKTFPGSVRGKVSPDEAWAIRSTATTFGFVGFCMARLIYGPSHFASSAAAATGLLSAIVVAGLGILHYKTLSTTPLPHPDDPDAPPPVPPFGPRPRDS